MSSCSSTFSLFGTGGGRELRITRAPLPSQCEQGYILDPRSNKECYNAVESHYRSMSFVFDLAVFVPMEERFAANSGIGACIDASDAHLY
jgi:hypothetical protein